MPAKTGLSKSLGFTTLLLITITSIMGTGIFFLPAVGAREGGPASIISWAILAFFSLYIASLFAELCSLFPTAGGIYEFAKQVYPRPLYFAIGWGTLVASNVTIGMLILGAIQYLLPFDMKILKVLISIFFILIFNYISFKGIKTSATMLVVFSMIILSTLTLLLIPNIFSFDTANLTPFFISSDFTVLFMVVFLVAETFFGWESPLFLTEETKNARVVVPRVLVIGTAFIVIFSLAFVVSTLGAVDWQTFANSSVPLLEIVRAHYGNAFVGVFTILVYLSIIGSVANWITTSPRLVLSLAKDNLFPNRFAAIHPKNATPHNAIMFQTIVSIAVVLIGAGSYEALLEMLLPLLISLYGSVILIVFILRKRKPRLERPFNAPFPKTGSIIVLLFLAMLMYFWFVHSHDALYTLQLAGSFLAFGIPVYFLMDLYYNPNVIARSNDTLAYLTLLTESLMLPRSIRQHIIRNIGNPQDKTVLEFGCSVGTLTLDLAEEVGKNGRIYATDISERSVNITQRRMRRKEHDHVTTLHDLELANRVHPDIPEVDVIVSVGTLNYLQNVDKVLHELNGRLKDGSRICFVEFDNFFFLMQNRRWISDVTLMRHVFHRNGFRVGHEVIRGPLWNYVLIYGKKVKDSSQDYPDFHEKDRTKGMRDVGGLTRYMEDRFEAQRRSFIAKEKCLRLFADPHLDEHEIWINEVFDSLIDDLLEISLKDSPRSNRMTVTLEASGDALVMSWHIGMDEDSIADYLGQSERETAAEQIRQERRLRMIHDLQGRVEHVYDGHFDATFEDGVVRDTHLPERLVVGIFDETNDEEETCLALTVRIPLKTIER